MLSLLPKLISYIINKLIFTYQVCLLFKYPANSAVQSIINALPDSRIMQLSTPEDLHKALDGLLKSKVLEDYINNQYICYVIFTAEHKTVAWAWVKNVDSIDISEVSTFVNLPQKSIVIFNCATISGYRGKRLYPCLLTHIINNHINDEKYIYANKRNIASKNGILRVGFEQIKQLSLLRILGVKFTWQSY